MRPVFVARLHEPLQLRLDLIHQLDEVAVHVAQRAAAQRLVYFRVYARGTRTHQQYLFDSIQHVLHSAAIIAGAKYHLKGAS